MLEEPLLDARLRINCWTTAFSLALDKRKVGSDKSHVVTQTAVNPSLPKKVGVASMATTSCRKSSSV
jgi:hypothetical protein